MYFNNKKDTNIDNQLEKNTHPISEIIKRYKNQIIILSIIIVIIIIFLFMFINKEKINITLIGATEITLYQGDEYIEPGYKAYGSKNKNLTNDVIVKTNLNVNKIGEYEIEYSLKNVSQKRKIKIVEKPKEYTYIYLNPINNAVNVYLNKGEKYIEPGYKVYNSKGLNLTDKVTISGTVDTSKTGIYKLIYSVKDSSNVIISVTRTIIVTDSEINLSLNPETYTKNNVSINVGIIDNYFDYMILPDGTKTSSIRYTYSVDKNGTYTFTTYNKRGGSKKATIEVKNIDRTAPTGSCDGYYQNGKSTIDIKANDNNGIEKYVINGITYNQKNVTINQEIKNANITIYDKAGNTKNISCALQNKNTQKPENTPNSPSTPNNNTPSTDSKPATNPLDAIYTSTNSHTNSKNGIRYLMYNQSDPKWGSVKYPNGGTIESKGCMITASAVVSSAYDNTITPKTVFDKYRHNYPYSSINKLTKEAFRCKKVSNNMKQNTINALSEGKAVVIMVYGSKKGGSSKFTTSQHYMALIDYKDGKIFVGNSSSNKAYRKTGWYDENEVLTSLKEVNVCTPTTELLNKFK